MDQKQSALTYKMLSVGPNGVSEEGVGAPGTHSIAAVHDGQTIFRVFIDPKPEGDKATLAAAFECQVRMPEIAKAVGDLNYGVRSFVSDAAGKRRPKTFFSPLLRNPGLYSEDQYDRMDVEPSDADTAFNPFLRGINFRNAADAAQEMVNAVNQMPARQVPPKLERISDEEFAAQEEASQRRWRGRHTSVRLTPERPIEHWEWPRSIKVGKAQCIVSADPATRRVHLDFHAIKPEDALMVRRIVVRSMIEQFPGLTDELLEAPSKVRNVGWTGMAAELTAPDATSFASVLTELPGKLRHFDLRAQTKLHNAEMGA